MKKTVSEIAAKGRYGDDALLHVSTAELQGLASLMPSGQLTTNPDTGLPEAFFFLPFLMGAAAPAAAGAAAAAAAPALAATTGAAAAGLGALGTGLGAGMSAATGALGAAGGLGSLAAAAPTAMTAAAPALASAAPTALSAAAPALASAAPTAMTAAAPTLASAAPTAASALPMASTVPGALAPSQAAIGSTIEAAHAAGAIPATGPMGVLPPSVNAIPGGVATPTLAPNPASVMGQGVLGPTNPISATSIPQAGDLAAGIGPEPLLNTPPGGITPGITEAPIYQGVGVEPANMMGNPQTPSVAGQAMEGLPFPEAPVAAEQGGLGSLMGGLGNIDLMKLAPLAMMMPKGGGGSKKKGEKKDTKGIKYEGGDPVFPDDDYRGGIDPEWRYFPAFAEGGIVGDWGPGGGIAPGDRDPIIGDWGPGGGVAPGDDSTMMQRTVDTRGITGIGGMIMPTTDSPYHAIENFRVTSNAPSQPDPVKPVPTPSPAPTPRNDPIIGDWGPGGGVAPNPTTPTPKTPTPVNDPIVGDWGPGGGQVPSENDPIVGDWGPGGGVAPNPTTPTPSWRDAYERHPSLNPPQSGYAAGWNNLNYSSESRHPSTDWGWDNQAGNTQQQQSSGGFDVGNWGGSTTHPSLQQQTQQGGMASQNTNNGQWGWGQQQNFASGGLASISPDLMAEGGVGSLMGAAPAAPAMDPAQDEMLIEAAVKAIQGQVEDPEAILSAFVQTFGEQALQELIASVQGGGGAGLTSGPGDGMSDSIPASIDGVQPASLSSGEFVVPADVVSGLGNGSTDAGAAQLEDMMGRVRQMRNGGKVQPPAINPNKVMPA